MKTVNIYMESRFNLERSILKESLGDGYVARTCAAQAPNFLFEVHQGQDFVLGIEVAGARSAEFLSIITEDYVYQHPSIEPKTLAEYLKSRAQHPIRRRKRQVEVSPVAYSG